LNRKILPCFLLADLGNGVQEVGGSNPLAPICRRQIEQEKSREWKVEKRWQGSGEVKLTKSGGRRAVYILLSTFSSGTGQLAFLSCDARSAFSLDYRFTIMGLTYIEGVVRGANKKAATVEFLVDSGAVYSLLPEKDWKYIGLKPKRQMSFTLADGTKVERSISECHITLPQGDSHTPVILGEPGDEALLGAVTLEILGLVLDPFKRSLHPMRAMLACFSPAIAQFGESDPGR
jgi:clan AA aspartic protease